jgi:hypothetical protein
MHKDAEQLIGKSTLEAARFIVRNNQPIDAIYLRNYKYIPDQPSGQEPIIPIYRHSFLETDTVEKLCDHLSIGHNYALSSQVLLSGKHNANFLMMGMAPRKTEVSVEEMLVRFDEKIVPQFGNGFLIETKKSYQFMGFNIVDQNTWWNFLATCLVSSNVTRTPDDQPNKHEMFADYRYIGYSMLKRSTGLRITTRGSKTFEPKVIAVI